MLDEAAPVITAGASHPFAGGFSILPALVATGLLEVMVGVYVTGRQVAGVRWAAFYGLRNLVRSLVFSFLAGERRADGLTHLNSFGIGGLFGLDRAPKVRRIRERLAALTEDDESAEVFSDLAHRQQGRARHFRVHLSSLTPTPSVDNRVGTAPFGSGRSDVSVRVSWYEHEEYPLPPGVHQRRVIA